MNLGTILISSGMSLWLAFSQRKRVMEDLPFVTAIIDRRFGAGTYQRLCRRLRPILLSMLISLAPALSCLYATYMTIRHVVSYGIGGVLLATTLGIFRAYLLSRRHSPFLE